LAPSIDDSGQTLMFVNVLDVFGQSPLSDAPIETNKKVLSNAPKTAVSVAATPPCAPDVATLAKAVRDTN
jgi:hypothetical protein